MALIPVYVKGLLEEDVLEGPIGQQRRTCGVKRREPRRFVVQEPPIHTLFPTCSSLFACRQTPSLYPLRLCRQPCSARPSYPHPPGSAQRDGSHVGVCSQCVLAIVQVQASMPPTLFSKQLDSLLSSRSNSSGLPTSSNLVAIPPKLKPSGRDLVHFSGTLIPSKQESS